MASIVKYFTPKELADRWDLHERTLANWRSAKRGPQYEKKGWAVLYPLRIVMAYERERPKLLEASRRFHV